MTIQEMRKTDESHQVLTIEWLYDAIMELDKRLRKLEKKRGKE